MIVLSVDPGPTLCGVVIYDSTARRVEFAKKAAPVEGVLDLIRLGKYDLVAIERVQSTGQAGASLLATSEVVGRMQQCAIEWGSPWVLLYRRDVLKALDVTGKGNRDSMVRQRCLEEHGGSKSVACGTVKAPGPLHGVAGHAWQALGVALAATS